MFSRYHDPMDRVQEILMAHSNAGTFHLIDAAHHFFMTRFMYEGLTSDSVAEARYDQLVEEAWSIFVMPSILSFHSWLRDVMIPTEDADELVNTILDDLKADWLSEMATYKGSFLENLA